jgi:hypothetical protein
MFHKHHANEFLRAIYLKRHLLPAIRSPKYSTFVWNCINHVAVIGSSVKINTDFSHVLNWTDANYVGELEAYASLLRELSYLASKMAMSDFVFISKLAFESSSKGAKFSSHYPGIYVSQYLINLKPYLNEFITKDDKNLTLKPPLLSDFEMEIADLQKKLERETGINDDFARRLNTEHGCRLVAEEQLKELTNRLCSILDIKQPYNTRSSATDLAKLTSETTKSIIDKVEELKTQNISLKESNSKILELEDTVKKLEHDRNSKIIELEKSIESMRETITTKDQEIEEHYDSKIKLTSEWCTKMNLYRQEVKEKFKKYKDEKIAEITLLKSKTERLDETLAELEVTRAKLIELETRQAKLDNLLSIADVADLVIEF